MLDAGTRNTINREAWLEARLAELPRGSTILDAGAGEQQYKRFCPHLRYISQDFGKYDGQGDRVGLQSVTWNNDGLDIVSDITKIPLPSQCVDAIMCVEVFEHLPDPIRAIEEFARLLRPGGHLIITAPFCSLTHFSPYHYYTGFNRNFYHHFLEKNGFKILEIEPNGNFFEYMAQEMRRLPEVGERYAGRTRIKYLDFLRLAPILSKLGRMSRHDRGSDELLCFGLQVHAVKEAGA